MLVEWKFLIMASKYFRCLDFQLGSFEFDANTFEFEASFDKNKSLQIKTTIK